MSIISGHFGARIAPRATARKQVFVTTSVAAIVAASFAAGSAFAQQAPAPQAAQAPTEEIVVTGTRVVRDGYEAPTPLTVVGVEQVQQAATNNTIDYLTTLPSMAGNYTPQNSTQNVSAGTAGTSSVNLRNLGTNRTLVLINGQRSVPSTITGLVDVNTIPQQLIERVDVVTGGASAAYGSDAVAGVVNFVLDTKFTGVKGEVSGGVTTYGDDRQWKVSLTAGTPFANDRGHFIISGSAQYQDGVLTGGRAWNETGLQIITNPAYGTNAALGQSTSVPQRLLLSQVSLSNATAGGIIVSGPLKGIAFGPGGQPYNFNYGSIVSGSAMSGGDWRTTSLHTAGQSIEPAGGQHNLFLRTSYQITDDIEVFYQGNWYENSNFSHAYPNDNYFGGLSIKTDNAYLPASIAAQAQALGLTTLTMGTSLTELGPNSILTKHHVLRNVVGANGKFDAFNTAWTWNAYYQTGVSMSSESSVNTLVFPNFTAAVDAVRAPNGSIVCRSNLTGGNPGCVPYNVFGTGVISQAAANYVVGLSHRNQHFVQDVEAASMTGNPFEDWAGPVSLALGIEHRVERASGTSDPLNIQRVYFAGNYLPTFGSYNVTEGFVETVVPLAKDQVWAKTLDLNAAVRATGYSNSGYVTTWKVGATWTPIDDITVRATRSRDIRAPNLNDLYNAGSTTNQNAINNLNGQTFAYLGTTTGNPNLVPEKADTTGIGVVLQPTFLPGFSTSVDYWNIDLGQAINTISAQNIVDLCQQGATTFCQAINNGGPIVQNGGSGANQINIQPFNIAQQLVRGIDLEASYRTNLSDIVNSWDGAVTVRMLSTFFLKNFINNTLTPPIDHAGENNGQNAVPDYRMTVSAGYSNDLFSATLTDRIVSSGTYNNTYIVCTSGCPVSTTPNNTINNNHIDGAMYFDLALTYKFMNDGASNAEAFFNIRNIANKDPVLVAGGPSGVPYDTVTTNPSFYDSLGRVFRAGIRFKM
jgi:outer membrane receptor protein involved in Fe transport